MDPLEETTPSAVHLRMILGMSEISSLSKLQLLMSGPYMVLHRMDTSVIHQAIKKKSQDDKLHL